MGFGCIDASLSSCIFANIVCCLSASIFAFVAAPAHVRYLHYWLILPTIIYRVDVRSLSQCARAPAHAYATTFGRSTAVAVSTGLSSKNNFISFRWIKFNLRFRRRRFCVFGFWICQMISIDRIDFLVALFRSVRQRSLSARKTFVRVND